MRRRHRRGHYSIASTSSRSRKVGRKIVALLVVFFVLYFVVSKVLDFFGVGNPIRRTAVEMTVEDRGTVTVSLKGEDSKKVEDSIKLYSKDRVETSTNANASLAFFDGSWSRLDSDTEITIKVSKHGTEESNIEMGLDSGSLWIATPTRNTYSGTIVRTVSAGRLRFELPSRTEAVITPMSIVVYAADGLGVTIMIAGNEQPVVIGEGQQFVFPGGSVEGDLYRYRSPLDPMAMRSDLVKESRELFSQHNADIAATVIPDDVEHIDEGETLTVSMPSEGDEVETSTVIVRGYAGEDVSFIRVNGYQTIIDQDTGLFTQELTLPDEDEASIHVEAVAEDGTILAEEEISITRNREPPPPPTITEPAKEGQTYRTNQNEIKLVGEAPEEAIGIIVNDYRLQLFSPGDKEWKYLASTSLDNFNQGENVFEVYSINRGGYLSEPAIITIVIEEGPEGIIDFGDTEEDDDDSTEPADTTDDEPIPELMDNAPLEPGSLLVTAPGSGTEFNATESEFLLEGTTSSDTESIWVNDYRLQLYEPGKTFWNYIVSARLNTLKRGRNTYEVVARNKDGQVLDRIEYVIYFSTRRR